MGVQIPSVTPVLQRYSVRGFLRADGRRTCGHGIMQYIAVGSLGRQYLNGRGAVNEYTAIQPISGPIWPVKRTKGRHYSNHPFFTKRAWNVVAEYIKVFSRPGDTVLDPFGGSGVTAIEAVVNRRRGVHIDCLPLANFIAAQTAVAPVNLERLRAAFGRIRDACRHEIQQLYSGRPRAIRIDRIPYWFPRNVPLPSNADAECVHDLFWPRGLYSLSMLLHHIEQVRDRQIRDLLRLAFSATLVKTNKTYSSPPGRLATRGQSGIFQKNRYWIPRKPTELNVWDQFESRFKGVLDCKRDTNDTIGDYYSAETFTTHLASVLDLSKLIREESIDYIYTDPPYGAHIAYFDLATMWHAWLRFDVTEQQRQAEISEGGEIGKSKDEYISELAGAIEQMFRVLRYDRWCSIVFSHKDPAYWDAIVQASQRAGFEYVNTAVQPTRLPSSHKIANPLRVLSGELVLNFRKVKKPRTIAIMGVGSDVVRLIKNTAELAIVRGNGASTDEIYSALIPVLLENGLLAEVKRKLSDVTPLLGEEFDFHDSDERWHIRPDTRIGMFIPLQDRIRFYLLDCLRKADARGELIDFDDIVYEVMPNLINGETPSEQTILKVLRTVAFSPDGRRWKLGSVTTQLPLALDAEYAATPLPVLRSAIGQPEHTEVLYRLARLGRHGGFGVHIGRRERRDQWNAERLSDLSLRSLPPIPDATPHHADTIANIDCLWLDRDGRPRFAFEVETTTPMTTAIERFCSLLTLVPEVAQRACIVAPRSRKRRLDSVLRESPFIGHPMYMENKVVYLYVSDIIEVYDAVATGRLSARDMLPALEGRFAAPRLQS